MLKAVLKNLLDNVWKFTCKRPHTRIQFGVTRNDGETAYFVRHNSIGFDMRYVDKLLGAFQRLHSMTQFEGSGIGLAHSTACHRTPRRSGLGQKNRGPGRNILLHFDCKEKSSCARKSSS